MNIDLHGFGPAMMAGTLMTVKLALCALLLGLVLGLLGALAKTSSVKPLQWLGGFYSTLVRGVPELLWVLLIYFGTVGLMNALGEALNLPGLELSAFAAGVIALGLCFGAYATEVFRGAILAIPKGHREAGLALGLSKGRILSRIILPQMWRIAQRDGQDQTGNHRNGHQLQGQDRALGQAWQPFEDDFPIHYSALAKPRAARFSMKCMPVMAMTVRLR